MKVRNPGTHERGKRERERAEQPFITTTNNNNNLARSTKIDLATVFFTPKIDVAPFIFLKK